MLISKKNGGEKALIKLNDQSEQKMEVQHLMNEDMKNEQKKGGNVERSCGTSEIIRG